MELYIDIYNVCVCLCVCVCEGIKNERSFEIIKISTICIFWTKFFKSCFKSFLVVAI